MVAATGTQRRTGGLEAITLAAPPTFVQLVGLSDWTAMRNEPTNDPDLTTMRAEQLGHLGSRSPEAWEELGRIAL
jgi:hypothetical protein